VSVRELDGFRSAGQQVGDVAQPGEPGRSGEQKAAGSRIGVDLVLDGKEQVGGALHLVDDKEAAVADEEGRICQRGRTDRRLVEKAQRRAGEICHNQPARVLLPVCRAPLMTTTRVSDRAAVTAVCSWLICREQCG